MGSQNTPTEFEIVFCSILALIIIFFHFYWYKFFLIHIVLLYTDNRQGCLSASHWVLKRVEVWLTLLMCPVTKVSPRPHEMLKRSRSSMKIISLTSDKGTFPPWRAVEKVYGFDQNYFSDQWQGCILAPSSRRRCDGVGVWLPLFFWPVTGLDSSPHEMLERGRCLIDIISVSSDSGALVPTRRWKGVEVWLTLFLWALTGMSSRPHDKLESWVSQHYFWD